MFIRLKIISKYKLKKIFKRMVNKVQATCEKIKRQFRGENRTEALIDVL